MTPRTRTRIAALAIGAAFGIFALTPQAGAQFDRLLKGAGILLVVGQFGPQINRAVNQLTGHTNRDGYHTKVVPILSVGQGAYAGAAQVSGPSKAVRRVQAVAQVEGNVRIGASLRIKALIPISTKNVKNQNRLARVAGVGVTGLIDTKL